jgi:hypothetical protein
LPLGVADEDGVILADKTIQFVRILGEEVQRVRQDARKNSQQKKPRDNFSPGMVVPNSNKKVF